MAAAARGASPRPADAALPARRRHPPGVVWEDARGLDCTSDRGRNQVILSACEAGYSSRSADAGSMTRPRRAATKQARMPVVATTATIAPTIIGSRGRDR